MADPSERWAWLRERTPAARQYVYLNCGWSGPLSTPVVEAMHRRIDLELQHGPTTRVVTQDRMALGESLREAGARLLGCDADEIAITGNTTEGVNIALNGLGIGAGDVIVTTNVEHSGGLVPAYYLRERHGAELRFVSVAPSDSPGEIVERFDAALGASAAAVVISEISFSTGQLLPLREIIDLAHLRGATVIVDGAQTAGHVPLDMRALGVDAYAVPAHKWLCGPAGLGLLFVRRDRIADITPTKVGGRAAASYDFEGAFEPQREAITKFEVSTVSGTLIAGMVAAIEQYLESGPQAVWDRARELTRYAEQRFERIEGVTVVSSRSDASRTGLFLFAVAGLEPAPLATFLQRECAVVCRTVKQMSAIRLSLHVYNVEDDIERTAAGVERAIAEGIPDDILEEAAAAARVAESA